MNKMLILFFVFGMFLIPFSTAHGFVYYETKPYALLEKDPTVCYISFDYVEEYENVTKQAISDWQTGLQEHTKNYDKWNIHYNFIQNDYENDVRGDVYSLGCDIFVDFVDEVTDKNDNVLDSNGRASDLVSGHILLQISTSNGLSYEQMVTTVSHELGHAFGLGHYITDEDELLEQWDQGIDLSSIMIQGLPIQNYKQITELDLKKMVTLYGYDGFEDLPQQIPEWIQDIFVYYGDGSINDSELMNAIQYLIENGIMKIS